jgi:hypothetical protein
MQRSPTRPRDDEQRVLFSVYMAFQYVRGRSYRAFARASATDTFKLAYGEITDEGIRHMLQEKGLEPSAERVAAFRSFVDQLNSGAVTVGPQKAAVIGMSGKLWRRLGYISSREVGGSTRYRKSSSLVMSLWCPSPVPLPSNRTRRRS